MPTRLKWRGRELSKKAEIGVSLAIEAFAVNIWSDARKFCPIDTGSLRNSIRIEKYGQGGILSRYVAYRVVAGMEEGSTFGASGIRMAVGRSNRGVGVGIQKPMPQTGKQWRRPFYALYVELGTSRMGAQPFMRPAFTRNRYRFKRTVRRYLRSQTG